MTQYVCNDEIGGPTGCLQYFYATSGTVASFNYPIGTSSIASATTSMSIIHLRFATENCKFMFPSSFTQRAWSFMREMPSRMMILVITSNSMLLLDDCALLRNDTYSNKEKKVRRMPRQNLNLMQRYVRNVNGTIWVWCVVPLYQYSIIITQDVFHLTYENIFRFILRHKYKIMIMHYI